MTKDNILVVSSDFSPIISANGVCANNLIEVFQNRNYRVRVLCPQGSFRNVEEVINGVRIKKITTNPITNAIKNVRIRNLIHRINLLFHFFMYPLNSITALVQFVLTIKSYISKDDIGLVLAINKPLIGCLASAIVKRTTKIDFNFIVYDVDSFSNTIEGKYVNKRLKSKLFQKWERYIFNNADCIIVMYNHAKFYSQEKYNCYSQKMIVANFPVLRVVNSYCDSPLQGMNTPLCVFLGTLSRSYRDPTRVCEVFKELPSVNFNLYGRIEDSVNIVNNFSKDTNGRINHGGVTSFFDGQKLLQEADILVSIGNSNSDMVPSKTFEYLSYCKPIIHFFSFRDDPVLEALAEYPLSLLLDLNRPIYELVMEAELFIKTNLGKRADPKFVHDNYISNTPGYSVDLIENFINSK